MLKVFVRSGCFAALCFLLAISAPYQALAQTETGADPSLSTVRGADVSGAEETVAQPSASEQESLLAAKYGARLDAMATNQKSFEALLTVAKWLGTAGGLFLVAASVFVGKTFLDLQKTAKEAALTAFEQAIREKTGTGMRLDDVFKSAANSLENLRRMETALSGYALLTDVARSASNFDPMVQYFSIRAETVRRRPNTVRMLQGDTTVNMEETTHDPEFRQKASVVFEKLLESIMENEKSKTTKLSTSDLFNAAAVAAEAELDFVAIELMEVADRLAQGAAPEIKARLIRQRLTMSRILPEKANAEIAALLETVNGFDLHLVVSEAFNIGLGGGDAAEMARLIEKSLNPTLRNISYTKLNGARLMFMGQNAVDWQLGEKWMLEGLAALTRESRAARWYEHSLSEVASLIEERPDLWKDWEALLIKALGTHADVPSFAAVNGVRLTNQLIRSDKIALFVDSNKTPEADLAAMLAQLNALRGSSEGDGPGDPVSR